MPGLTLLLFSLALSGTPLQGAKQRLPDVTEYSKYASQIARRGGTA